MYRIVIVKNYRGEDLRHLQQKEGERWLYITTINDKNYQKFLDRGLNPLNSEDIVKFMKYDNL